MLKVKIKNTIDDYSYRENGGVGYYTIRSQNKVNEPLSHSELSYLEGLIYQAYYKSSARLVRMVKRFSLGAMVIIKVSSSFGKIIYNTRLGMEDKLDLNPGGTAAIVMTALFSTGNSYITATTRFVAIKNRQLFYVKTQDDIRKSLIMDLYSQEGPHSQADSSASQGGTIRLSRLRQSGITFAHFWAVLSALVTSSMAAIVTIRNIRSLSNRLGLGSELTITFCVFSAMASLLSRFAYYGRPLIDNVVSKARLLVEGSVQVKYTVSQAKVALVYTKIGVGLVCFLAGHYFKGRTAFVSLFELLNINWDENEINHRAHQVALTTLCFSLTETVFTRIYALHKTLYDTSVQPTNYMNIDFRDMEVVWSELPWWACFPWLFAGLELLQLVYSGTIGNIDTFQALFGGCEPPIDHYFQPVSICVLPILLALVFACFSAEMDYRFGMERYCTRQAEWFRDKWLGMPISEKYENDYLEFSSDAESKRQSTCCWPSLFCTPSVKQPRRVELEVIERNDGDQPLFSELR